MISFPSRFRNRMLWEDLLLAILKVIMLRNLAGELIKWGSLYAV